MSLIQGHIHEKEYLFHCLEIPFSVADPVALFHGRQLYPKVFWHNQHSIRISLGSIVHFLNIPKIDIAIPCFGGIPFSQHSANAYNPWQDFPSPGFFIPEIVITLPASPPYQGHLCYYKLQEAPLKEDLLTSLLQSHYSLPPTFSCSPLKRQDYPSYAMWEDLITKAKDAFAITPLEKVVLARASEMSFQDPVLPAQVLKHLFSKSLNATLFAYQPSSSQAFIGASPELLYLRDDLNIFTMALAGTKTKNSTHELMQSAKDRKEFDYVASFLSQTLSRLCTTWTKDITPSIRETATLQHLYRELRGQLHSHIDDNLLIEQLHPTPAIGGFPRHLALNFLHQHEPFARGHYAAPLGWLCNNKSEFIVAIRSALIKNNLMTVFAGAGIISDSDPMGEWNELEAKISHFH